MVGMLQILTYLLAFYLIVKGVEILQIGLASNRERRGVMLAIGAVSLLACVAAAIGFVLMQDRQALSIGNNVGGMSERLGSPEASASVAAELEAQRAVDEAATATDAAMDQASSDDTDCSGDPVDAAQGAACAAKAASPSASADKQP